MTMPQLNLFTAACVKKSNQDHINNIMAVLAGSRYDSEQLQEIIEKLQG